MVYFDGIYILESEENLKEFLSSLGYNDFTTFIATTGRFYLTCIEDKSFTFSYPNKSITYPLNVECNHNLYGDKTAWTTATLDCTNTNTLMLKTKITEDGSISEETAFQFLANGVIVNSSNSLGIRAVRRYKKME